MWHMICGALLAAIGFAVGVTLSTSVDASAEARWWELLTAVGTFGAVVVALVFGLIPLYQQARRDRYRAQVVRWLVLPWLGRVLTGCREVEMAMGDLLRVAVGERADGATLHALNTALPMIDARRLIQHSGELYVLNAEAQEVAEAISDSDRLHDLLSRMELSRPLSPERAVFSSTSRQAKELAEKVERIIRRHAPA